MKTIVAIDPGASGGIVIWKHDRVEHVVKMPKDLTELNKYFIYIQENNPEAIVFIEKVQMFGSDSDEENKGKQFRIKVLLANYENLKALITFHKLQFCEVFPATWQSVLGFGSRGIEKEVRKNMYKKFAGVWFPSVITTLWNADALCILKFALKKYEEDSNWIAERIQNKTKNELF